MNRLSKLLVVVGVLGLATGCTALLTGGKKREKPAAAIEYHSADPQVRVLTTEN
ncbi:MAG: hypothetical protein AAGL69_11815 [Pseudomonadota bacterium]